MKRVLNSSYTVSLYCRARRYSLDMSDRAKSSSAPVLNRVACCGRLVKDKEKKFRACNSRSNLNISVRCSFGQRLGNRSQAKKVISRLSVIGRSRNPGLAKTGTYRKVNTVRIVKGKSMNYLAFGVDMAKVIFLELGVVENVHLPKIESNAPYPWPWITC